MKSYAQKIKVLVPLLTLFLVSCGVHNHRYDTNQDVYYQDDYYAYDPYYGYGSSDYTDVGDGVYYNNYNYYPDRWGVTYSSDNFSPYRYPRVGFYFSSGSHCSYSYWSTWCSSGYWPSSYYSSSYYGVGWWPSYGFGLSYSSYYYDNYWWYNHWRNRNYYHNSPNQYRHYSARSEAVRLANRNSYSKKSNRYKTSSPSGYINRNNKVDRSRSSSRPVYRAPNRQSTPQKRTNQTPQRSRQEAIILNPSSNRYKRVVDGSNVSNKRVGYTNDLQQTIRKDYNNKATINSRYRQQKPTVRQELQKKQSINQGLIQSRQRVYQNRPVISNTRQQPATSSRTQQTYSSRPVQVKPQQIRKPTVSMPSKSKRSSERIETSRQSKSSPSKTASPTSRSSRRNRDK